MIDYSDSLARLEKSKLKAWAAILPEQIAQGLSHQRYGDLKHWLKALEHLPHAVPSNVDLKTKVRIGAESDLNTGEYATLKDNLLALRPWRKGPFQIFDVNIDTEWRSDWKWERLLPHIAPLKNRTILDVGCGNGYHCWRMLGEEARQVIGIDPSPRFVVQFHVIKKYLPNAPVDLFPVGIQDLPNNLQAFDTTFSMGVLYHRRSPMDHLKELRDTLRTDGELILETLIIDGQSGECLVPEGRYAKMNNVWFIPSAPTLISWLKKCGFENVRCVDINSTSMEEQRATEWVTSQSLEDFLDPNDQRLTVEGHPAPLRGIFIANRKN